METARNLQIYSPIEGILIITNAVTLNITANCAPERIVNASFIVRYDNCSILANGTRYADTITTITEKLQINLIKAEEVKTIPAGEPLSLRKLQINTLKTEEDIAAIYDNAITHLTVIYILIAGSTALAAAAWTLRKNKTTYTARFKTAHS